MSELTDNELIREFMNVKSRVLPNGGFPVTMWYREDPENFFSPFDYSSQWNYIMPVVEKIRKVILPELHKSMPQHSATPGDLIDVDIACGFMEVDIKIVYKHVVEFIKWYNSQQSSNSEKQTKK